MATQKICDECGEVGTTDTIANRALLVSQNEKGTIHVHIDASADKELCDKCMKAYIADLSTLLGEGQLAQPNTRYASRVQPR